MRYENRTTTKDRSQSAGTSAYEATPARPRSNSERLARIRRGNVLVLVAGILVLLVIIAFSYLSRTQSERDISIVQQDRGMAADRARLIGEDIAGELRDKLFPRPIDPASLDPNWGPQGGPPSPRENPNYHATTPDAPAPQIEPTALPFSIDRDAFTPIGPDIPWNAAPYSTKPWTNWPDFFVDTYDRNGDNLLNDSPRSDDVLGNPGTNDGRIYADPDPARIKFPILTPFISEAGFDGAHDTPDIVEYFTHWLHMSNPMRPGNGYMLAHSISNVESSVTDALSFTLGPYGTPFEQWLPYEQTGLAFDPSINPLVPANSDPAIYGGTVYDGKSYFPLGGRAVFDEQWERWFYQYEATYIGGVFSGTNFIPANYYRLADCGYDLDGDGTNEALEEGERPQDEFIGPGMSTENITWPEGTPRWNISRVLADTDGDGYTDSFWFLAPSTTESDLRTLMAIRVVDLCSAINVSTATQFVRGWHNNFNPNLPSKHGTRGWTPSEVALYEDTLDDGVAGDQEDGVGFLSIPEHWEEKFYPASGVTLGFPDGVPSGSGDGAWGVTEVNFGLAPGRWPDILLELGRLPVGTFTVDNLDLPIERLDYWRRTGVHPFDPRPPFGVAVARFTPFALSDGLELWAHRASNQQWNLSPLEMAFSTNNPAGNQIIRGTFSREEQTEYLDQLDTRLMGATGMYFDEPLHDLRHDLTVFSTARNETMHPALWWGYRWPWPYVGPDPRLDQFIFQSRLKIDLRELRRVPFDPTITGQRTTPQRLIPTLLLGLTDGEDYEIITDLETSRFYYRSNVGGVFTSTQTDLYDSWRLGTAYAANILSWQDFDDVIINATGLPGADGLEDPNAVRVFPDPADATAVGALRVPGDGGVAGAPYQEGVYHDTERYLGLEAQPFLMEVFIGHIYDSPGTVPFNDPIFPGEGQNYVVDNLGSSDEQTTVVCIQIANPFDRPIDLAHYRLKVFGQDVPLSGILLPATEERPRTAIIYSIVSSFGGEATFGTEWQDYLDIQLTDLQYTSFDGYAMTAGAPNYVTPTDTVLIDATTFLSKDIDDYKDDGTAATDHAVTLERIVLDATGLGTVNVVIDRVDNPNDPDEQERFRDVCDDLAAAPGGAPRYRPPLGGIDIFTGVFNGVRIGTDDFYVIWARATRLWRDDDYNPTDGIAGNFLIEDNERAPRYVFSSHTDGQQAQSPPDLPENTYMGQNGGVGTQEWTGDSYDNNDAPDGAGVGQPWIVRGEYGDPASVQRDNRKPVFFTCYSVYQGVAPGTTPLYIPPSALNTFNLADKGVKGGERLIIPTGNDDFFYPHPMQMLLKNNSFEQVGELLNVFLFGHLLEVDDLNTLTDLDDVYVETDVTFSEYMSNPLMTGDADLFPVGTGARTNRLVIEPQIASRDTTGVPVERMLGAVVCEEQAITELRTGLPDLPAGVNALMGFVCDGPGYNGYLVDANGNGIFPLDAAGNVVDPEDLELQTFYNATAFSGFGTPGMININTAPIEVMRALPHLYRLVHENNIDDGSFNIPHLEPSDSAYEFGAGRGRVPEAAAAYRDRLGVPPFLGIVRDPLPMYGVRGLTGFNDPLAESRGDRGFESIGELALLDRPGRSDPFGPSAIEAQWDRSWRIDQPALNHLGSVTGFGAPQVDVNLSTDLADRFLNRDPLTGAITYVYDETANDDEEANLLFAGLSNLVTTRSDSFVVYLRIRNVRQGTDGVWNATDPQSIMDDTRYVMVVDRSNVNRPNDEPRILLFEELPD